ncbi:MAG: carbon-nitrogen hydrolase family protein [Gammaproteobacteria bacterium]|nr:carbon-nitrogen hydrolase family protein [Gammaproteobacteria bacterium]
MSTSGFNRRKFNKLLATGLLAGWSPAYGKTGTQKQETFSDEETVRLQVAAIQMVAKMGDVSANLKQAEHLIKQAIAEGTQWIILPEMFTSAAAFHDDILKAIQPLEGAPLQLLIKLAHESQVVIGGSFLAESKKQVFNTFVLVFPDGTYVHHNKDLPTYWENCYYQGGSDDGVLNTPLGPVGSVLCWELIRSQTARRLLNKVRMIVSSSCWWTLPDDANPDSPRWASNLKMLQNAPPQLAKMLGVPVIHGSHAGSFNGYFSPELPDISYDSSYLGESMIVDAKGKVLAKLSQDSGEGVISAEIEINSDPVPSTPIPDRYWMPDEMPEEWNDAFNRWFERGGDYYELVTKAYLETGIINEYTPEYLR